MSFWHTLRFYAPAASHRAGWAFKKDVIGIETNLKPPDAALVFARGRFCPYETPPRFPSAREATPANPLGLGEKQKPSPPCDELIREQGDGTLPVDNPSAGQAHPVQIVGIPGFNQKSAGVAEEGGKGLEPSSLPDLECVRYRQHGFWHWYKHLVRRDFSIQTDQTS
jgi:hypothetical protein